MKHTRRNSAALMTLGVALYGCAGTFPHINFSLGRPDSPALAEPTDPREATEIGVPSDLESAVRQAQAQRKSGDLDGATRTLSQLVLVAPDDPRVLGEYGKTLLAKGQIDDALAFLTRALELQPNEWTFYSAQGVAYDQRGNYRAAQASYARALTLKPEEPTVLSNAGLSQIQSGNLEGAENLLRRAVQDGAPNARIAQNLAMVQNLRRSKPETSDNSFLSILNGSPRQTPAPQVSAPAQGPQIAVPAPIPPTPIPAPVRAPDETASVAEPATTLEAPETTIATAPAPEAAQPAAPLTGAAALARDPTVVMAPIPRETPARPAQRPTQAVPPRNVAAQADTGLRRLRLDP